MVQPLTYEAVKNIIINDTIIQDNLEDFKYMFRNEIGSARNMYRINTVSALIDSLERHDALAEFNIEPLMKIANAYGGSLAEIISSYHVLKPYPPYNEYREIRLAYDCAARLHISGGINASRPVPPTDTVASQPAFAQLIPKEKRAAIYKLIAEDIGTGWRCLGRELEIRQGTMDDIEIQYRDLNTRVYKLFQTFEEDVSIDPKQHLLIICRALDECRRKDLRRKVERIMSH